MSNVSLQCHIQFLHIHPLLSPVTLSTRHTLTVRPQHGIAQATVIKKYYNGAFNVMFISPFRRINQGLSVASVTVNFQIHFGNSTLLY